MNPTRRREGVGGWLLVFVILQILALGFGIFAAQQADDLRGQLQGPLLDPELGFERLLGFEISFHVARSFGILLGFILLALRRPITPLYWQLFLLASIVGFATDIVLGRAMVEKFAPLIPAGALVQLGRQMSREVVRSAGAIVGSILWIGYWQVSRRVANTYRAGGEEFAVASPGDLGPRAPGALLEVDGTPRDVGFGERPTRDCPSCGTLNLLTAHFCRGCRVELEPAELS